MWIRIAALVALVLVASAAGTAAYVAANRQDAPSVEDGDLLTERPAVAEADNAYADLEAAAEGMLADDDVWTPVSEMLRGESWDEALVDRLLTDNRDALALVERASRKPALASPPFRRIDDPLPDMLRWQRLARLLALRAIREARSGRAETSIATALADFRLARLVISDREAVLIHAMIGLSLASIGTSAITMAMSHIEPTVDQSRAWTAQLEELRVDPAAWRAMWGGEYRIGKQLMVEVTDIPAEDFGAVDRPSLVDALWRRMPRAYRDQPNRSMTLQAELIRTLRNAAGRPCAQLEPVAESESSPLLTAHELLRPNGVGRIVVETSAPSFRRFEFRRCSLETRIEANRAQIAIRAHEVEKGRLPDTLATLAPRYLDAPPTDVFAGKPLAYDRDRRELRSVGSDLVSGGACDADGSAMVEPCYPIPAAPSAG